MCRCSVMKRTKTQVKSIGSSNISIAKVHPHVPFVATTNTPKPKSAAAAQPAKIMVAAASASSSSAGSSSGSGSGGSSTAAIAAHPHPQHPHPSTHQHHPFVVRYQSELSQRRYEYVQSDRDPHLLPPVAETLNALALVHHHMVRDPESALRCHLEALGILEECIAMGERRQQQREEDEVPRDENGGERGEREWCNGYDLPALRFDAAVTLSDVGDARYTMGAYEEASGSYAEALVRYREAGIDEEHPRVVSTRNRLDRLRWRGDADAAQAGGRMEAGPRRQAAFVAKGA